MAAPNTVDDYIAAYPAAVQARLEAVRAAVRAEVPAAGEKISYGMPTFTLNGKNLVHFAAFKAHIGFYPTPQGIEAFQAELAPYQGGKGSARFPLDQPLPLDLIRRITAYRAAQLTAA
jgi:uncharacterized protein YdhG (YjbR/CyaY superfamily)